MWAIEIALLSFSLKNDFLYIFLVCQCLGVFLFVLRNHFDILQFSAFSITFVELKYDFSVPEIPFCSDLVMLLYEKK